MRCSALTKHGTPCRQGAITGGTVCRMHGGGAKQVKALAAVRAEVMQWRLTDVADDPGELLMRLMTQARRRAEAYALELERIVSEAGDLSEALIGDSMITGADGKVHKAGEYVRGMVELESQERDRAFGFAAKAVAAGLAERQVRVAEEQAGMIAAFIRALVQNPQIGLTPVQQTAALRIASKELRALPAA